MRRNSGATSNALSNTSDLILNPLPGILHDCPGRVHASDHGERGADHPFLADDRHFHASAVAGKHYQRSQALVEEVGKFDFFRRLLKNQVMRQLHQLKRRPDEVVFAEGQGKRSEFLQGSPIRSADAATSFAYLLVNGKFPYASSSFPCKLRHCQPVVGPSVGGVGKLVCSTNEPRRKRSKD